MQIEISIVCFIHSLILKWQANPKEEEEEQKNQSKPSDAWTNYANSIQYSNI